jgi:hypothetical protein
MFNLILPACIRAPGPIRADTENGMAGAIFSEGAYAMDCSAQRKYLSYLFRLSGKNGESAIAHGILCAMPVCQN